MDKREPEDGLGKSNIEANGNLNLENKYGL